MPDLKGLLIHFLILAILLSVGYLYFFDSYLPTYTHHDEAILVPNLKGMTVKELKSFLKDKNLRFTVNDSGFFDADLPPGSVINQNPSAGAQVKENRNIYIAINASSPPMISFPEIHSVTDAQVKLASLGIKIDTIKYVPDLAKNLVLEQIYKGKKIKVGDKIPKGAKIILVAGKGLDEDFILLPDFRGMKIDGMEEKLRSMGLVLGSVFWEKNSKIPDGEIFNQKPLPSDSTANEPTNVKVGEMVDLWVSGEQPKTE